MCEEIVINDHPINMRDQLTRRAALVSVEQQTGTHIVVKGRFYPPGAVSYTFPRPFQPDHPPAHIRNLVCRMSNPSASQSLVQLAIYTQFCVARRRQCLQFRHIQTADLQLLHQTCYFVQMASDRCSLACLCLNLLTWQGH